jgi:hypothetical protein
MTSKALTWARKYGLNCEQDIMAATLRSLCRLQIQIWIVILILLALLFFAGKAEAWSPGRSTVRLTSIPSAEPPKVREALPTCAEYVEMDRELRQTGVAAVLTRVLGTQDIEGEQLTCMLEHVYKIDMTINNICTADPGLWRDIFVRAVALYSPHCGLAVSR